MSCCPDVDFLAGNRSFFRTDIWALYSYLLHPIGVIFGMYSAKAYVLLCCKYQGYEMLLQVSGYKFVRESINDSNNRTINIKH